MAKRRTGAKKARKDREANASPGGEEKNTSISIGMKRIAEAAQMASTSLT